MAVDKLVLDYPNEVFKQTVGIGLTSQRNRDKLVNSLINKGLANQQLINALRIAPRHLFIESGIESMAYDNCSLPIAEGQTISQPEIVMYMTQSVCQHFHTNNTDFATAEILEIGTGSGYQTCVLALIFGSIFTIERIKKLHLQAKLILNKLQVMNINYALSDGHFGWSPTRSFDAIVVTAAPSHVPAELVKQLKNGGVMIIPTGDLNIQPYQTLLKVTKQNDKVVTQELIAVKFVPMLS